jgi:predicted DNA binding protein
MNLSRSIGSTALGLAVVVATVYALGEDGIQPPVKETMQKKLETKEAQRRAAVAEQKQRKADFARHCSKDDMTDTERQACRAAYRRL